MNFENSKIKFFMKLPKFNENQASDEENSVESENKIKKINNVYN